MNIVREAVNKLPKNKLARVAIISAAIGASLLLLPFVLGGVGGWFAYTKITSPKARYFVVAVVAILALFIGIPWTKTFFAGETATTTQQAVTNAPAPDNSTPQPKIEKKTITETSDIAFDKTTVDDPTLDKGKSILKTKGVNGVKTSTFEITLADGVQTDKKLTKEETTTNSIAEVTAIGTKIAVVPPACDPNYSGACVPIASDVDCLGGSGNGPAYVKGPVYVIGKDIYHLDSDGNGIGCEN